MNYTTSSNQRTFTKHRILFTWNEKLESTGHYTEVFDKALSNDPINWSIIPSEPEHYCGLYVENMDFHEDNNYSNSDDGRSGWESMISKSFWKMDEWQCRRQADR